MVIKTSFTKLLNISHPIVSAPMALVSGSELAVSVQKAGGLGLIGGSYCKKEFIENQLENAKNCNVKVGIGFITWALKKNPSLLDLALSYNPSVVFFSFGDFSEFTSKVKAKSAKVIAQVQSIEQAENSIKWGADVIVAQGTEAGGHSGFRSTLPLVPAIVDLVNKNKSEIPVLAAGGIADGRGLAAALMLGAQGVVMGTRFYASKESIPPLKYKQRLVEASGDEARKLSIIDELRELNWEKQYKCKFIRNNFISRLETGQLKISKDNFNNEKQNLQKGIEEWDLNTFPVVSGEAADLIKDIPSASEIVQQTVDEAVFILKNSAKRYSLH